MTGDMHSLLLGFFAFMTTFGLFVTVVAIYDIAIIFNVNLKRVKTTQSEMSV